MLLLSTCWSREDIGKRLSFHPIDEHAKLCWVFLLCYIAMAQTLVFFNGSVMSTVPDSCPNVSVFIGVSWINCTQKSSSLNWETPAAINHDSRALSWMPNISYLCQHQSTNCWRSQLLTSRGAVRDFGSNEKISLWAP